MCKIKYMLWLNCYYMIRKCVQLCIVKFCLRVFGIILFLVVKYWKEFKCLLIVVWINMLWYIYIIEDNIVTKINKNYMKIQENIIWSKSIRIK